VMPDYEFDDALRRALHTAADGIDPGADGLERIRGRLSAPRPMSAAWLLAGYGDLARPAVSRLRWLLGALITWLWPPRTTPAPRRPSPGPLAQRYRWLRAAAVASAVVVAVAGGYGLSQLRSTMANTNELILPLGHNAHHQGGTTVEGHGGGPIIGPSNSPGAATGFPSPSPSPSASCPPKPVQSPPVHNPPSGQPTPTPTETQTQPYPTPTPTPSPTGTGEPTGSPSPSPSDSGGNSPASTPSTSPASAVYAAAVTTSAAAAPGPSQSSGSHCGTPPSPSPSQGTPRHGPNQRAGKHDQGRFS
jgi:hypothetical protein